LKAKAWACSTDRKVVLILESKKNV
jgi:hypothetical protein